MTDPITTHHQTTFPACSRKFTTYNRLYPPDHPEYEPTFTTAEARTLDFLLLYGLSPSAAEDCLAAIQEGDCPHLSFSEE